MDYSGRERLCGYGLSSVGSQAFEGDASVWRRNISLKEKPSHLVAPSGFHETDSAEDYMAGLAEEIARSMLEENEEGWRLSGTSSQQVFLSTSPQSTLAGMSSWDLLSPSAGSNGDMSSGMSSPPTPVAASHVRKDEDDALNLLYAELLRLKMEDDIKVRQQQLMQLKQQQHYQKLLWKMRQRQTLHLCSESSEVSKTAAITAGQYTTSICSSNQKMSGSANGYCRSCKLTRSDHQDPNQSRRKQMNGPAPPSVKHISARSWAAVDHSTRLQQIHQNGGAYANFNGSQHTKALPALNGSGMRAFFLGTPGARESGGTGVFLPRRVGNGHDAKRKPACSTVLLPSRIVQALNLDVEDTVTRSFNPPPAVSLRRELVSQAGPGAAARERISCESMSSAEVVDAGGKEWTGRDSRSAFSSLQEVAPDVCLPTEWTY